MITKQFPQFSQQVEISLFKDVGNSQQIRENLLKGNEEYNFAFINAATVVSIEHVLAAVYRALNDYNEGNMRSKTIHSEIVHCLSPSNNIIDGLKRFGVSDDTTALVAIKVGQPGKPAAVVQGTEIDLTCSNINMLTDIELVKKLYKLDNPTNDALIPIISLRGF